MGFGKAGPGDLSDALAFLDHLVDLGVNAVELLPMAEFSGNVAGGMATVTTSASNPAPGAATNTAISCASATGGASRSFRTWSTITTTMKRSAPSGNTTRPLPNRISITGMRGVLLIIAFPDGGYLDNGSTGYTPRFWEEIVRQQFISSAAFLIEEMHVDGLRVDLTQAIHRDNALHADGRSIGSANVFGQKFLREWSRTLRMIRPTVMLIAEDHTGWDAVTKPPAQGGLGFDARWEVAFYHNLIGDSDMAGDRARLLKQAGFGGNEPLQMDWFSGALYGSRYRPGRLPRISRRGRQCRWHCADDGDSRQWRSAR